MFEDREVLSASLHSLRLNKFIFRVFWMLLMVLSFSIFCFLFFKTTNKFMEDKVIIDLSRVEIPIGDIPFPAVTLCPDVSINEKFKTFDLELFDPEDDKFVKLEP
jgi:Amiloride-sensitive sodium channel